MRIAVISSHNVHSLKHKHPEHEWFLAMDAGEHSKLMDNNSEFYSFNPDVVLFSLEGDCDVYSGRVARHLPNTPIFIQYNLPSVKKHLKLLALLIILNQIRPLKKYSMSNSENYPTQN
jgi:hypothetical protein